jgi:glycine/D-amino acid oxidase-like deaminating enzyme
VCGWGASGCNAGYVTPTLGSDPRILKRFYADRLHSLYDFANNAVAFTEDLMASRSIECGYRRTGNIGASPTAAAFRRLTRTTKSGRRTVVADAAELGIPSTFFGGVHLRVGGVLNPGELSLGVRDVVLASEARVFEQSAVRKVVDKGDAVIVELAQGRIRADQVVLTNNAFMNSLEIAPDRIVTPIWVTAVETEPVSDQQLDAAGWTSRTPITTSHHIMQSFRTTSRGTIVHSTRNLRWSRRATGDQLPDTRSVNDLIRGFRERFPSMAGVSSARTWGGWIGLTPSNMAVAGHVTGRVHYSVACNGHGLPQAPYLGALLADHLAGDPQHDDLKSVWRERPRFAPGIVNALTLKLGWTADRLNDRLDRLFRR